jgi:hypothetical protein
MVDPDAYAVGESLATTPGEVVLKTRVSSSSNTRHRLPLSTPSGKGENNK